MDLEKEIQELLDKKLAKNREEAEVKAKEMIDAKVKALEKENSDLKSKVEENEKEVKAVSVKLDEKTKEIEGVLTEMNRVKAQQQSERKTSMKDAIYAALEQKEADHKEWIKNKSRFDTEIKAVGVMSVPTGGVAPDFQPIVGMAHETDHARNAIPVSPTQSNLIKYIQFSAKEGAIGTVAAGGTKPAFDWNRTVKEAPVKKVAGHITVHDEFLEDIVGSRDFIASELPQALLDAEDEQIFMGDGTGENLTGIYTGAVALVLPNGTVDYDSNRWDKLAAAIAQIRRYKRKANACWLSPEDYKELLIYKTTTGEYSYPMLLAGVPLNIGGVPIYQHTVFAEGEALVGDFARGARLFQRMAQTVRFSTEHSDNFIKNQTTILIEERIALAIYYTDGFVKIDFDAVDPTP